MLTMGLSYLVFEIRPWDGQQTTDGPTTANHAHLALKACEQ